MNPKKLIVLGGIFGVLILTVLIIKVSQSDHTSLIDEVGMENLAPDGFLKSDVAWVEIWRQGSEPDKITVNRTEKGWTVGSRFDVPADETKVEKILDLYKGLMGEMRSDQDDLLADYGLQEKAIHLKFVMSKGKGDPSEIILNNDGKFVRRKDESKVYAVAGDSGIQSELGVYSDTDNPDVKRWIKKDILKVNKDDVKKITAVYPDRKLVLEKREKKAEPKEGDKPKEGEKKKEYEWVVTEGAYGGVTPKAKPAEKILGKLENFRITDAVDPEKKAEWGLDNPPFRLEAVRNDDTVITIVGAIDKPGSDAYVMLPDMGTHIYTVSNWNFTGLFPKAGDIFDGLPEIKIKKDDISEITVVNFKNQKYTVKQDGAENDLIFPKVGLRQKKDKLASLLKALENVKIEDSAAPDTPEEILGFSSPSATAELVLKDGQNRRIILGNPTSLVEGYYVKFSWIDGVYAMRKWKAESLFPEMGDLFEKKLLDLKPLDVTMLKITSGSDVLEFTRAAEGWTGTENSKKIEVNSPAVEGYLGYYAPLSINDVALREGDSILTTVSIKMKDGKEYKLFIQKGADGFTLTEASTPGVYSIDEMIYKRISAIFDTFKIEKPKAPQPEEEKTDENKVPEKPAEKE